MVPRKINLKVRYLALILFPEVGIDKMEIIRKSKKKDKKKQAFDQAKSKIKGKLKETNVQAKK